MSGITIGTVSGEKCPSPFARNAACSRSMTSKPPERRMREVEYNDAGLSSTTRIFWWVILTGGLALMQWPSRPRPRPG